MPKELASFPVDCLMQVILLLLVVRNTKIEFKY